MFCSRRLTRKQLNLIYRPAPGVQNPSCLRWSDQRRGRFLVSLSKARSGGWRPSRMASRSLRCTWSSMLWPGSLMVAVPLLSLGLPLAGRNSSGSAYRFSMYEKV